MTEIERPAALEHKDGDTEYTKGYKDGVYDQMKTQAALRDALKPSCLVHVGPTHGGARCIRCGERM